MNIKTFLENLPEVKAPEEKKPSFNSRLKWTLIILAAFFVLSKIPLYGLAQNTLEEFEFLSIILASDFGSVISLGIGPIVMASIILQLLVGSKLLDIDLTDPEGKKYFQGLQKILAILFCIFEASVYVLMGGLTTGFYYHAGTKSFLMAATTGAVALSFGKIAMLKLFLILQLFVGGMLILFMDEVISKHGFSSGVSLFILAGVGQQFIAKAIGFGFISGKFQFTGEIWTFVNSIASGTVNFAPAIAILVTIVVFFVVVYAQSMKVEIPLSFGRIRGFGIRWPLEFFYTSVIPVILVGALVANMQLVARLLQNWLGYASFLGGYEAGHAYGLISWLSLANLRAGIFDAIIKGYWQNIYLLQAIVYLLFMSLGSMIFALFWVKTSGMDAENVANQIVSSGLQIPGFRQDTRVLETILSRYIMPLALMGGIAIGMLAALADILGALIRGTGLLLAVMISYRLFEEISRQHAVDMHPALKKIIS